MGQESRANARIGRASRLFGAAALLLAGAAAALALWRGQQDRRWSRTGQARWIWYSREIPEPSPLSFRAWKDFVLDGAPPASAPLLLFGDREWVLRVNGSEAARGSQKPGDPLASLDAARFLRSGENRVEVEANSPNGAGGILLWLEMAGGRAVVSDGSWRVERISPPGDGEHAAVEWGRPPIYPWRYPE